MLGTACVGPTRAPGCYQIKGQTDNPVCNPKTAVRGLCNFKKIQVPWDSPMGRGGAGEYNVYQALDVGAQIKLQLQRALIRFGYAAATLAVYSDKVLDRHFAAFRRYAKGGKDLFAEVGMPTAHDLAKTPTVVMWDDSSMSPRTQTYFVKKPTVKEASTNHTIANLPSAPGIAEAAHDMYAKLATIDQYGDSDEQYLRRSILPHYSRVLPHTKDNEPVPKEIGMALKGLSPADDVMTRDINNRKNTFYSYEIVPPDPRFPMYEQYYVPYPIFYAPVSVVSALPNPAYLNEKYATTTGVGARNRRALMMHRGAGMLLRAMQHLHNAMVLYVMASLFPMESDDRWGSAGGFEAMVQRVLGVGGGGADYRGLLTVYRDFPAPKGAMAFLTMADTDAVLALFKGLAGLTGEGYDFAKKLFIPPGKELMRDVVNGKLFVGEAYKDEKSVLQTKDRRIFEFIYTRVVFLEVLWSYWYDNNSMGRLRKRADLRAKLARVDDTVNDVNEKMKEVAVAAADLKASILDTYMWKDPVLQDLVIMHLQAMRGGV
jgi:hypothetical protein